MTDRRVVIIHHSFWGLYTKINLLSPTEINVVQHANVKSVALGRGLLFGTARLRLLGFVEPTPQVDYEWDLSGMWIKDALQIITVIGRLIEERSEAQDARISSTNAREGLNEDANTRRSDVELDHMHKRTVMQKTVSKPSNNKEGNSDAEKHEYDLESKTAKAPIAYVIKNDKVVASEKIEVPKQNSKIYGRLFGILILIIGAVGMLYSSGYDPIPFLNLKTYFSLADSTFILIIGIILIKLA